MAAPVPLVFFWSNLGLSARQSENRSNRSIRLPFTLASASAVWCVTPETTSPRPPSPKNEDQHARKHGSSSSCTPNPSSLQQTSTDVHFFGMDQSLYHIIVDDRSRRSRAPVHGATLVRAVYTFDPDTVVLGPHRGHAVHSEPCVFQY